MTDAEAKQAAYEAHRQAWTATMREELREQRIYNVLWERLLCQPEGAELGYEERVNKTNG